MSLLNRARVVIYRFHEKGLEIFLINNEMESDTDIWRIPQGLENQWNEEGRSIIDLDIYQDEKGESIKTFAIEGDWHDIPSIRGMLKHDIKLVKSIVKEKLPESEKGAYFAIKEAFKKVTVFLSKRISFNSLSALYS